MASERLLRGWLVLLLAGFAAFGAAFLIAPVAVQRVLNQQALALGFQPVAVGQDQMWLPLAIAYMVLITALCAEALRHRPVAGLPVRLIVVAKVSSSLLALAYFLLVTHAFGFLVTFVVDGGLAIVTFALYLGARSRLRRVERRRGPDPAGQPRGGVRPRAARAGPMER
jgi:hypothetical protein